MIIVVFGPEASGKMTIGQELTKYNFNLLFNHQIIDLVGTIYNKENIGTVWNFKQKDVELITKLFSTFLYSAIDNNDNLVFTITWNFNNTGMKDYFFELQEYAKRKNTSILFVELFAPLEERLKRNKTPNRLENKICKRDLERSDMDLIDNTTYSRLNSNYGEMDCFNHYLFFDNTNILPCEIAKSIIEYVVNNC